MDNEERTWEWIPAIYNRTYGDVQSVQYNPDQENPIGCWNVVDLNRLENNTYYVADYMYRMKIVRSMPEIHGASFEEWTSDMIPDKSNIDRIMNNIKLLIELSSNNPAIADQLPTIYASTQPNYVIANQLEFALDLMHNQPKLPLEYWNVTITHGIVSTVIRADGTTELVNSSTALVAEDEVVTILGVEYGENAQYQDFTYWSGRASDIGLLTDYEAKQTTFTMPYRDIEFAANFETHIPRTLTLTNAYISVNDDPTASTGPTTGTYLAGDRVMIIANAAPSGKVFYEWLGTQEGLDNIVAATNENDPSTAYIVMPDCNVTLEPKYINAGQHLVTVSGGSGTGQYAYGEYVSIYANIPSHHRFVNWSGNTSYLSDITSAYQSFVMGDVPLTFTAHTTYAYSTNSVQVIDGQINIGGSSVNRGIVTEGQSYTLIPNPPDASQGIQSWTVEGYGSVSGNTFTAGDGNAIITGNYAPYRVITVKNINNGGGTNTYNVVQGRNTGDIWTAASQGGNYKFNGWYENGDRISTNRWINLTAGESDREVEAIYDYYPNYTVTVINKNNSGVTTTSTIVSGEWFSTSTNEEQGDYLFTNWSGDKSSSSTYIEFRVTGDTTITANYRPKETYTLTVNNGSGSGQYKERQWINIVANTPSAGASFTGWSTSGLRNINNSNASSTSVQMGRSDATCTANYSNLRSISVITNSGTSTYSIIQGNRQYIVANPAPSTWEFNHWETTSGDATFANYLAESTYVYANAENSTVEAVYTAIPTFNITMRDGRIQDYNGNWVTNVTLRRDATNAIIANNAPVNKTFLQWNVYENGVLQTNATDVYEPLASTSRLRCLSRDITIEATYYTPDPETKYTLTIHRKDGTTSQNQYSVGYDANISASYPDQGMEFYKWTGDTAYVAGGVYNAESYVHMPAQDVDVYENYVPEGYIPQYDLDMTGLYGECCYETEYEDPETGEITVTEHWVSRHSYPEGTRVKIRATGYAAEYYFSAWEAYNHDSGADARSILDSLVETNTTLTMPDYDVDMVAQIALKQTYEMKVNDGRESGFFYKDKHVDIWFNLTNTNNIHYTFIRWTGTTVSQLKRIDGTMFDPLDSGQVNHQVILMPAQRTEITATYKTLYRTTLVGGTIDSTGGLREGYYETNTALNITADPAPTGMRFQYWAGDTSELGSIYDPTTTLNTVTGTTDIRAIYSTDADRNEIGYSTLDLKNVSTIDNNDITIISGEIEVGFILTDVNGHIYIITNVDDLNNTSTIYRMTKVVEGGNVYG